MNVFTAYIAWICISQFASHKYLTPDLYVLICSTITTFINSYLPPTLEMESTHINSESDGSWDPDDMCLVDLQFEGDDSVPDDCFGCLDEKRKPSGGLCSAQTGRSYKKKEKRLTSTG
jgi:hypothetical protein